MESNSFKEIPSFFEIFFTKGEYILSDDLLSFFSILESAFLKYSIGSVTIVSDLYDVVSVLSEEVF